MHATREHARKTIQELARRRQSDKTIDPITSVELLHSLGYTPSHYAKVYGQVVSLLDVTCVCQELPLIGKLVKFGHADDDVGDEWSLWRPHMAEIEAAAMAKQWTDQDIQKILDNFPNVSAKKWWKQNQIKSAELLQSALSVVRR
jgi:hypothetical protein